MNTEKVIKRDQKYIMHTYARSPLVLEHGEGMYAYDADGKAYLDFTSGIGVNALGYCHPAWVQAVTMQATRLQHSSNLYYTAPCGKLAKRLCARTGLDQVFFGNSGAEANEGAIKCARKYSVTTYGPDRNKVLTLVNSFHGRTLATLTATGQEVFHNYFFPFTEGFRYADVNSLESLEAAAGDDVCAVMLELVQAKGDYLRKAIEALNLPCFGKTRGMGLMIGIEVRDSYDKGKILSRLIENGLLVLTAGPGMRLLPPLTITKAELDQGLEIMKKALENF